MNCPFDWRLPALNPADLDVLDAALAETVIDFFPFARGPVTFFPWDSPGEAGCPAAWRGFLERVRESSEPVVDADGQTLFLPLHDHGSYLATAAVEGMESGLAEELSPEWMQDRCRLVVREFQLRKELAHDPVTGMLNGRHLRDTLRRHLERGGACISLLLLALYPPGNRMSGRLQYFRQAASFLQSLVGSSVMHHLGEGVFGFVLMEDDEQEVRKFAEKMLAWLKRENHRRAHLGITTMSGVSQAVDETLDQAWQSLEAAARRGPYALCTYSSISDPDGHPLRRPPGKVLRKLRRAWRGEATFTVVLCKEDILDTAPSGRLPEMLTEAAGDGFMVVPLDDSQAYVLLVGQPVETAEGLARDFLSRLGVRGMSCSMGIATYPCLRFTKTETAVNAGKALLHAAFFGPGAVVRFDAVSLNVSGDIYYGEGDLMRAVRDYRRGLALEPGNINLLNSLGEAYAQMNRHRQAGGCFEAILARQPDHYMALCNQGVVCLMLGRDLRAVDYFERALAVAGGQENGGSGPHFDLLFQLGRLYCRQGRYAEAVALLEREAVLPQPGEFRSGRGMSLRYLGEACMGLGENTKAIRILQQALRYNPGDADALSMLGELYGIEDQGEDIALSLCRQALEINDVPAAYWYRLAWLLARRGERSEALAALKACLKRRPRYAKALLLAGRLSEEAGWKRRAVRYYEKILTLEPDNKEASAALSSCGQGGLIEEDNGIS